MKKPILLSGLILICSIMHVDAQLSPTVTKAKYFDKTNPLREMTMVVPGIRDRSWKDNVIENKFGIPGGSAEYNNPGPDPVWQKSFGEQKHNEPIYNFDGIPNVSDVLPPDTDGDVGPDHYFQIVNMAFQIFDKEGNSLYGPADNSTLWDGFIGPWTGHNDGDPIVVYDELADRWVVSQFALECTGNTWWELVAVSVTGDPLGSWYRYAFEYPVFNDYPKLSVWPDAYYCSFNLLGDDYARVGASAYEREAMLVGDSNAKHVLFDMPLELATWAMLPADFDGTPPEAGTPSYWTFLNDDDYIWWTEDLIRVWEFNVNWDNPESSTFEEVKTLPVEPFSFDLCGSGGLQACIPQPGNAPLLDALSGWSMQPLQYRNFGDYETMVFNHTVNADGNGLAGIRWYELRKENENDGWYIYQQGTYAPDDNYRWMGSIAMDARGYIALGYTVSSTSVYPSLRYTGRPANAPLGEMTFTEEEIIEGTGSQFSSYHRWGDYSMMAVDPSNDTTFWYTGEYMATNSDRDWKTRIAAFNLTIDVTPPAAITDLQAQNTTTNAVQLNWTATGNDGSEGTAYYYEIRYNTEIINEGSWENSMVAENDISPAESGNPETFVVTGLEYSTNYYFAIKAGDKQYNISDISNSPSGVIAGPPHMVLDEPEVEVKIFEPGLANRPWVIKNTGETDINFELFKTVVIIPENEGNVLDTFENGAILNRGMAWVDGYLYMVDQLGSYLYSYDTALQLKVDTFNIHSNPSGLCWDGTYFWIGDENGVISAYNLDGTSAFLSFSCPFKETAALTYTGELYVVSRRSAAFPEIFLLDQEGNEIKSYKTNIQHSIMQITWAEDHYGKNLWYIDQSGMIGQLNFVGDSALVSLEFDAPGGGSSGIVHDGSDLWQGKNGGLLYRVDDGVDELPWFSVEPAEGTIVSDGLAEINLQVDLTALPVKDTSTILILNSNDPSNSSGFIPISLEYSIIDLGYDTSFCGNLQLILDAGNGYKEYLWSDGSEVQTMLVDSAGYGLGTTTLWAEALDYCGSSFRDTILITIEDCSGIDEFEKGAVISIIPNPNEGVFDIIIQGFYENIELQVSDINGRIIYQTVLVSESKDQIRKQIDLSEFSNGIYIIKLIHESNVHTEKVIIR